jgi:lysophospholipase L1-like esterase
MRSIARISIASATSLLLLVAAAPLASAGNAPHTGQRPHHAAVLQPSAARPADLTGKNILVYGPAGTGGFEESVTGATYTVWDAATWASKTTADFAAFSAIVFEDPSCGSPDWSTAVSTASTWAPAVTGNVFINGTDPNDHGMNLLPQDGVTYAATGHGTGVYVSLSCTTDLTQAAALLSPFGNFSLEDPGDCGSAVHVVWSDPALTDLTDSYLSGWGCSVHEGFTAFPASYHVFAIDTTSADPWFTAPDGTRGLPYILIRGTGLPASPVYAALGDSYSSGEGNPPFIPDSNFPGDRCHRSLAAYSEHLTTVPAPQRFEFVACSGAKTAQITGANTKNNEPAQVSALSDATTVVTITIGGNDIGFPHVIEQCVALPISCKWLDGKSVPAAIKALRPTLLSTYTAIHAAAPNALLVVGGYPDLFAATSIKNCHGVTGISTTERAWLNSMGDLLNSTIQAAVTEDHATGHRTVFAPVNGAAPGTFTGHQLCSGSSSVYLRGESSPPGYSFHPNAAGQLAYAAAFDAAIKSAGL